MRLYSIVTYEYDADIAKLLSKRLNLNGAECKVIMNTAKNRIEVEINNEAELHILSQALSGLLTSDLMYFELAFIINSLPFDLNDRREILKKAVEKAKKLENNANAPENNANIADIVYEYLQENELLILEGYLRFRMQDTVESWRVCADTAAEEVLLRKEYNELIRLIGLYTEITESNVEKLTVVLHPDGSSTLTDNDKIRIDCSPDGIDGMLSMLIGISPQKIVIYDLSCGQCEKLKETVILLFGERVFCYNQI